MKSKVLERGYINVYSDLPSQVRRQLEFTRKYKLMTPGWDATTIRLCQIFEKTIKPEMEVLDAGCGNGNYVVDEYRDKISHAVGVDLKPEFTTKNNCLDEIVYADLDKMPFESDRFDVVLCFWVLEHVVDPLAVFEEVARVLKRGGYFIFCTPNKNSWLLVIKRLIWVKTIKMWINKNVYGREEKDVFDTFYRANDLETLKGLSERVGLAPKLELNCDPAYTSFEPITFRLSGWLKDPAHIIGVCQKEEPASKK